MTRLQVVGTFLLILAGVVAAAPRAEDAPAPSPDAKQARPVREFNLFAKEWSWDPQTLRVKKGSHVILHIESLDGARSFALKPYGLTVPLPEGERVTVEFDADQEGTFEFKCGRPCGNGCAKLRGTLTVH